MSVLRGAFLAGVSLGVVALGTLPSCAPQPTPANAYVICDDTTGNVAACPANTTGVVIDNSL